MSWAIDLKANRKISPRSVDTVFRKFPMVSCSREVWGWSAKVDVLNPRGCILTVSGAGFSAHAAITFAEDLASRLRKLHYKVVVGKMRD